MCLPVFTVVLGRPVSTNLVPGGQESIPVWASLKCFMFPVTGGLQRTAAPGARAPRLVPGDVDVWRRGQYGTALLCWQAIQPWGESFDFAPRMVLGTLATLLN